jgi:hypothetical protein
LFLLVQILGPRPTKNRQVSWNKGHKQVKRAIV